MICEPQNIQVMKNRDGIYHKKIRSFSQAKEKLFKSNSIAQQNCYENLVNKIQSSQNFLLNEHSQHFDLQVKNQSRPISPQFIAVFSKMCSAILLKDKLFGLSSQVCILDLSENQLSEIPEEVFKLKNLITLKLDNNLIQDINIQKLSQLDQLKILSLSGNIIKNFKIDQKQKLEHLNISYNHIEQLDPSLFCQEKIATLMLQSNYFNELPRDFLKLGKQLQTLGFGWGRFCHPPINMILTDEDLVQWFKILEDLFGQKSTIDFIEFVEYFSNNHDLYFEKIVESFEASSPQDVLTPIQTPTVNPISKYKTLESNQNGECSEWNSKRSILIETFSRFYGAERPGSQHNQFENNNLLSMGELEQTPHSSNHLNLTNKINKTHKVRSIKSSFFTNVNEDEIRMDDLAFPQIIEKQIQTQGKFDFFFTNQYNQNMLHLAVINDEFGVLQQLMKTNPDLCNQIDLKGHTPLSLAIEKQKYFIAQMLVMHGADVRIGGGLRSSNLHLAAMQLQTMLARDLLQRNADPDQQDIFGDTPLHSAARGTDFIQVLAFFQEYIKVPSNLNQMNIRGQTVLEILCERGNIKTLEFCQQINEQNIQEEQYDRIFLFQKCNKKTGNSLLHVSIQALQLDVTYFLLTRIPINLHQPNFFNKTPFNLLQDKMYTGNRKSYTVCLIISKLLIKNWRQFNYQIKNDLSSQSSFSSNDDFWISKPQQQSGSFCDFSALQKNAIDPKIYQNVGDQIQGDEREQTLHNEDFSDGGELSSSGDQSPKQLCQALERMKIVKPKFQPKFDTQQRKQPFSTFNFKLYTQGEDPYELAPPEDEFLSFHSQPFENQNILSLKRKITSNKTQHSVLKGSINKFQSNSNSCLSSFQNQFKQSTESLNTILNFKQPQKKPKVLNFSPNNIRFIEGRNVLHQQVACNLPKNIELQVLQQTKKLKIFIGESIQSVQSLINSFQKPNQEEDILTLLPKVVIEQWKYCLLKRFLLESQIGQIINLERQIDSLLHKKLQTLDKEFDDLNKLMKPFENTRTKSLDVQASFQLFIVCRQDKFDFTRKLNTFLNYEDLNYYKLQKS